MGSYGAKEVIVWSSEDGNDEMPLHRFGPPPGALPGALSFDPNLVERLYIRGLDLQFCRENYHKYLAQQKKQVEGQGTLF